MKTLSLILVFIFSFSAFSLSTNISRKGSQSTAGFYYNSSVVLSEGPAGKNTIDVGTWVPANAGINTNVVGLDFGATKGIHKYMRVGNMLYISGGLMHNVSVTSNWGYSMTLPAFVVNSFTSAKDCSGTAVGLNAGTGTLRGGSIEAEGGTNRIRFKSGVSDTGGPVDMVWHATCIMR